MAWVALTVNGTGSCGANFETVPKGPLLSELSLLGLELGPEGFKFGLELDFLGLEFNSEGLTHRL